MTIIYFLALGAALALAGCGGTCTSDDECGDNKPFCVDASCVECRTTDDCRAGALHYDSEGHITSVTTGESCKEHKCEQCHCLTASSGPVGFGLLLGIGALLLGRRRGLRWTGPVALAGMAAVVSVGCGDSPGSAYEDAFERYQAKACECGGGPVQSAFCSADASAMADCIDGAYDEGTEVSRIAIDCTVDALESAAACLDAIEGCDMEALQACGESFEGATCPAPSEATLETLNSCAEF